MKEGLWINCRVIEKMRRKKKFKSYIKKLNSYLKER